MTSSLDITVSSYQMCITPSQTWKPSSRTNWGQELPVLALRLESQGSGRLRKQLMPLQAWRKDPSKIPSWVTEAENEDTAPPPEINIRRLVGSGFRRGASMRTLFLKFEWNSGKFSMIHRKGFPKDWYHILIDGIILGALLQTVGSHEVISGHLQGL